MFKGNVFNALFCLPSCSLPCFILWQLTGGRQTDWYQMSRCDSTVLAHPLTPISRCGSFQAQMPVEASRIEQNSSDLRILTSFCFFLSFLPPFSYRHCLTPSPPSLYQACPLFFHSHSLSPWYGTSHTFPSIPAPPLTSLDSLWTCPCTPKPPPPSFPPSLPPSSYYIATSTSLIFCSCSSPQSHSSLFTSLPCRHK